MDVRQLIAVIQPPLGSWLWFLVLAGMIVGGIGYRFLSAVYRNWCMSRRFKRGEAAEKKAVRFLQRQGYRILAAQLEETITVYVDGVPQKSKVRADFFVRKGRKKYIVEVKSGQQGTVRLPNVRRQLWNISWYIGLTAFCCWIWSIIPCRKFGLLILIYGAETMEAMAWLVF